MKVLFISSSDAVRGISPIVLRQAESLVKQGCEIDFYGVEGKGIIGYLKNRKSLKKKMKAGEYQIFHAHYSLTAFLASLTFCKPLVVSLMGSDVKSSSSLRLLISLFSYIFSWQSVIVKSVDMKDSIKISKAEVISNGVDTEAFNPKEKNECRRILSWDLSKKHFLFAANPNRYEKNYKLTLEAFEYLDLEETHLHYLENVDHSQINTWVNAADVILLSSLWEGSPNIIKEAMACNKPIVSTGVGDVSWLISSLEGCYISSFEKKEFASKMSLALDFANTSVETNGRNRIFELNLDSEFVSKRIIDIYNRTIN